MQDKVHLSKPGIELIKNIKSGMNKGRVIISLNNSPCIGILTQKVAKEKLLLQYTGDKKHYSTMVTKPNTIAPTISTLSTTQNDKAFNE